MIRLLTVVLLLLSSVTHAAPQLWVVYKSGLPSSYLSCSTEKVSESIGNPTKSVIVPCINGISMGQSSTMSDNTSNIAKSNLLDSANPSFDFRACYGKSTELTIASGSVTTVISPFDASDMLYRKLNACPKYTILLYDTSFNYAVCNADKASLSGDSNLILCDTLTYGTGTSTHSIFSKFGEYFPVTTTPTFTQHYSGDAFTGGLDNSEWPSNPIQYNVTKSANLDGPTGNWTIPPDTIDVASGINENVFNYTVLPGCANGLKPWYDTNYYGDWLWKLPMQSNWGGGIPENEAAVTMVGNSCQSKMSQGDVVLRRGTRITLQVTSKSNTRSKSTAKSLVMWPAYNYTNVDTEVKRMMGRIRYWVSATQNSSWTATSDACKMEAKWLRGYNVYELPPIGIWDGQQTNMGAGIITTCDVAPNSTYYINVESFHELPNRVMIQIHTSDFK